MFGVFWIGAKQAVKFRRKAAKVTNRIPFPCANLSGSLGQEPSMRVVQVDSVTKRDCIVSTHDFSSHLDVMSPVSRGNSPAGQNVTPATPDFYRVTRSFVGAAAAGWDAKFRQAVAERASPRPKHLRCKSNPTALAEHSGLSRRAAKSDPRQPSLNQPCSARRLRLPQTLWARGRRARAAAGRLRAARSGTSRRWRRSCPRGRWRRRAQW